MTAKAKVATDPAVALARRLLADAICECGHYDLEHLPRRKGPQGRCLHTEGEAPPTCACRRFRAVRFHICRED